jgi:hypothetical protein
MMKIRSGLGEGLVSEGLNEGGPGNLLPAIYRTECAFPRGYLSRRDKRTQSGVLTPQGKIQPMSAP